MFSGFSSYLGFNPQGSESVQALLQKTDLCLDELLDDEGLLTELKTQNDELLSFLKADENYTKMLNHVIREPSAEEQQLNPQRCFKFPLVSTDVLSSECALVQYLLNCNESNKDSSTSQTSDQEESPSAKEAANQQKTDNENNENPKYLDYLFTLLDNKELNFTAAGYFAKIVANLCEKHSPEFFAYIYKKHPEHLEKLANHVSCESIADLLFRIMSFEVNMVDGPNDEIYTIKRAETLLSLIKKLDAEHNPELASGAAYVVSEVIDKSTAIHKGDEIIACLIETEPIVELYKLLKTKNPTTVSAVTTVLGKMFANHIVMALETDEEEDDNFGTQEDPKLSSDLPLVAVTIQNVQAIVSIIAEAQEGNAVGSFRMKLLDLMGSCLEANNVDINAKIVESGFFKVALNLLLKFEWNNILHNKVEALINDVLTKEYENLKVSLFENAQILNTIIEAFRAAEIPITGKKTEKKIRKGYLGHLVKLANKINDSEDPAVRKYLEKNTAWEEFVVVELEEANKKNRVKLGGVNPKFERCGSFEVQHWSTMTCMQTSKIPLDSEEQQNNQEGLPEIEKIKLEEGMPPTINMGSDDSDQGPKLSKFSQVGAAEKLIRRRSSRDQSAELEILAEKLGRRKSSKDAFDMDTQEEPDQILTTKSLHMKFSQLGAAGKLARRRSSAKEAGGEEEIAEEVVETTQSPMLPGGLKFFKFEEIIDESIEENIQAEQDTGDEPSNPVKGLKIPLKFM